MHGLEFQALAAVDRHQPDRIHVQGGGRDLAQVALLGEQHKLAHAIERALDRDAEARPGCASRRKLRNCQIATLRMRAGTRRGASHLTTEVGAIEQIGG